MKTTGYFTTPKPIRRKYPRTLIDDQKDAADMLIEGCEGNTYTVNTKGIELTGKGVKCRYNNDGSYYEITERLLRRLEAQYNIMTNF
ncbi:MAG: hypothetical protein LBL07_10470 [Tannerella sp.]|nr:hypothetical protein [Tannerella sp.]